MQTGNDFNMADAGEQQGLAVFWHYLAQIFMDIPNHSIIGQTRTLQPFIEQLREYSKNNNATGAAEKIRNFLEECNNLSDKEIDERLNLSYTALFYLDNPVFITESAWLSPDGLNMQEQWEEVLELYRAWGFEKPEGVKEPEDHIGLECLFMSALSNTLSQVLTAQEDGWQNKAEELLKAKLRFLKEHLNKWSGMFAGAVVKKSHGHLSLYAGGALLILALSGIDSA